MTKRSKSRHIVSSKHGENLSDVRSRCWECDYSRCSRRLRETGVISRFSHELGETALEPVRISVDFGSITYWLECSTHDTSRRIG